MLGGPGVGGQDFSPIGGRAGADGIEHGSGEVVQAESGGAVHFEDEVGTGQVVAEIGADSSGLEAGIGGTGWPAAWRQTSPYVAWRLEGGCWMKPWRVGILRWGRPIPGPRRKGASGGRRRRAAGRRHGGGRCWCCRR